MEYLLGVSKGTGNDYDSIWQSNDIDEILKVFHNEVKITNFDEIDCIELSLYERKNNLSLFINTVHKINSRESLISQSERYSLGIGLDIENEDYAVLEESDSIDYIYKNYERIRTKIIEGDLQQIKALNRDLVDLNFSSIKSIQIFLLGITKNSLDFSKDLFIYEFNKSNSPS